MLPFAPGITGSYIEKNDSLALELKSLRNPRLVKFKTSDQTIINTIKQDFSPILGDYLGDYLPGFGNAFLEMQSYSIPVAGEEREFEIFKNVAMKFCWIPAGKAILGSSKSEKERIIEEAEHEFETTGFWLGKYPVTQIQWQNVMGNNPSYFKGDNLPVEKVNWNDCRGFVEKCKVSGLQVEMPHEDQWEYACQGGKGNKQAFYWGNELNGDKANCDGNYPYGTNEKGIYLKKTSEVGSYEKVAPHPWNLCDMHGNVWEWCNNLHMEDRSYYAFRAFRGGGWGSLPVSCRWSCRYGDDPRGRGFDLGFRLIIC